MKTITNIHNKTMTPHSPLRRMKLALAMFAVFTCGIMVPSLVLGQESDTLKTPTYTKPFVWFGVSGGANFNFYRGTTQQLNRSTYAPTAFNKGDGIGLFLAPSLEIYQPGRLLGFMLQAGYDSRKGTFDQVISPCNCPQDLETDLSYITFEPSLRLAPFKNSFFIFVGPRFGFVRDKSFTYLQGINPDIPDQVPTPEVKGDFRSMNKSIVSLQVGFGVDVPLSNDNSRTQFMLSPFASFHPYMGQRPRSIESWDMTTIRLGATLKFGRGKLVKEDEPVEAMIVIPIDPVVAFTVNSPKNIPAVRNVRETFPINNYIYFDQGSTVIPRRYVLLSKSQVADFKEDNLESFASENPTGRSKRQMTAYYNILNILGERMNNNPNATITLVGSSENSPTEGREMAVSVQQYLTSIFGINASRIKIEGRNHPKTPSLQPGGTLELELLKQEDRRVTIESNSPALLMEFQTGSGAALKPVQLVGVQVAPQDSYVTFNAAGANDAFTKWSVEMKDKSGKVQFYGPFTEESTDISGKSILGTKPEGKYTATLIGSTADGRIIRKDVPVNVVLWTPDTSAESLRYSVLYEFNDSNAITIYDDYLTKVVVPKIPKGASVVIHGYTDVIGDAENNKELSLARANDVKKIIQDELTKVGRTDVKIEVTGYGENEMLSPFENKLPEERSYNRTVLIDIIPIK
jgi:outer membrane protein OmpA-like peptidoglycan-associated protein